jgi:ribosomal protein S25
MSEDQSTVAFKDIPSFPGYRVGDDGSVWTSRYPGPRRTGWADGRRGRADLPDRWKRMAITPGADGRYPSVCLRRGKAKQTHNVHRLVMLAFVGPCPDGMEVAHEDGNKLNSRLGNLSYKTPQENQLDRIRHGTDSRGEKNKIAKLTDEKVRLMRREYEIGGVTFKSLAARYGVSKNVARVVVRRLSWKHVAD